MFDFTKKNQVMGILNATPDSFSDGGKYNDYDQALLHAEEMLAHVDLIDIGGQSTRPGYKEVSAEVEAKRILPIIEGIRKKTAIPISVDTYYPQVAQQAIQVGADIINDIKGLDTPGMIEVIAKFPKTGIVIMHSRPRQKTPIFADLQAFFAEKYHLCQANGITDDRICFDPGLGFGKTVEENIEILQKPEKVRFKEFPLLYGVSRKRTIGTMTGETDPGKRDYASIAASLFAANQGVEIVRVHEVRGMKQTFAVWERLKQ